MGEAETLLLAQQECGAALINENAARKVALEMKVPAHCALDVLVAEFKMGRLEPRKLQQMYEQLREADLDAGEVLPNPYRASKLLAWGNPGPE